jgi:beta-galactosidase/beta-glucuronidase
MTSKHLEQTEKFQSRVSSEGMFTYLFFSLCCSFFIVTFRRKVIKRIQDHENPKVQGIDRIPIHSLLIGFISDVDARNFVMQPKCSPYVHYLDGNWFFNLHRSFQDALMMLGRGTQASTSHLVSCSIPYQWQLLNHGDPPISTNLPFENLFIDNPAGYYQCHFEIPAEWERRQIRLMFGGVGSAFYVWINGNFVGFSKDSKLSTEYNITQSSKIGRGNLLELIVVKFSDSSNLENHGSWKLSGIFREIYIMSLPQAVHIQDYNWIYRPEQKLDSEENELELDSEETKDSKKPQQVALTVKIQLEWDAPSSCDSVQNQVSSSLNQPFSLNFFPSPET